jgi:hypothetical protein
MGFNLRHCFTSECSFFSPNTPKEGDCFKGGDLILCGAKCQYGFKKEKTTKKNDFVLMTNGSWNWRNKEFYLDGPGGKSFQNPEYMEPEKD